MSITLKVTDTRKERNPSKYSLTVPDGCTVAQFIAEVAGAKQTLTVAMGKNKAALKPDAVLEDGDVVTVRV
jgi:sulfur carrier protein ThiS